MNSLRTLLLHLDGSRAAPNRLAYARDLAAATDARLDVAYAVAPRFIPVPIPGGEGIPPAPLLQEVDGRHRRHAKALFTRVLGERQSAHWIDLAGPGVVEVFLRHARVHDLAILGQPEPGDPAATDMPSHWVETVVLNSGVPAVIVPWAGEAQANPDSVLVAWKSTPESARALASAWPVLSRAKAVHLAIAKAGPEDSNEAEAVSALLRQHGVNRIHVHPAIEEAGAGEALLSLAADCGAGLLVMGVFGHSRAREWILGGVSRTILASMTVPVWTAH